MRIAQVASVPIPSEKASGVQTVRMCEAFARQGHDVTLFARPGRGRADARAHYGITEDVRIEWVDGPRIGGVGGLVFAVRTARRLAAAGPWDLVYGRHAYTLALARALGCPCVYEAHEPPWTWLQDVAVRLVVESEECRRLVVTSEGNRSHYLGRYPGAAGKIRLARNGTDIQPLHGGGAPADREGGPFRIGYVGSLHRGRGLPLIMELARAFPTCELQIVGGTSAKLREIVGEVPGNVTCWGYQSPGSLREAYARMDLLLAPYERRVELSDGRNTARWMSPLKLFEYMGSGVPMVASRLPAVEEFLRDGETAVLADPDDTEEWISAVELLRGDAVLAGRIARRAREEAAERYSWDRRARWVLEPWGRDGPKAAGGAHELAGARGERGRHGE